MSRERGREPVAAVRPPSHATPQRPWTALPAAFDRFSVLAVAFAALLWSSDVAFRVGLIERGLTGSQMVLGEDVLISVALLPVYRRAWRQARCLHLRGWLAILLVAAGPQAAATVMFTQSLSISFSAGAPSTTYLLQQLQPLFAIALAGVILRERRRPVFWPLMGLSLTAVYVVVFAPDPMAPWSEINRTRLAAAALAIGAAGLWASGTVLGRYVLRDLSFVATTTLRFVLAIPVLVVIVVVSGGVQALTVYRAEHLPDLVGLALIPGLVALTLYYRALRSTPASLATVAETTYPIAVTLLLALPAPYGLGQQILVGQIIGTAVLVAMVIALNLEKRHAVVLPTGRFSRLSAGVS